MGLRHKAALGTRLRDCKRRAVGAQGDDLFHGMVPCHAYWRPEGRDS